LSIDMKKKYLGIGFLLFISISVSAIEIPSGIITALSSGDASALSAYFSSTIELTLFEKEEIYSRTQAEIILRKFFSDNPPRQFKILHEGGKDSSKYAIGSLTTSTKSFRITFLLKMEADKVLIHQLRIENEYAE
jgi:hypothetical protein